ncbi:hypothetical protein C0993_012089 [Termitomyces sp. T159_Od127]|nr:hypothetical protein C0993_012089 [Termitomyces sp. T159_Od127]
MCRFTLDSSSPWIQSEPYKTGKNLLLTLASHNQYINVRVVKMYPPTNSVVLLVDNLNPSSNIPAQVILKLADRRFGNAREEFLGEPAWPWTMDAERDFQAGLRAYIQVHGHSPDLSLKVNSDDEPEEEEDVPTWMQELEHWNTFHCVHQNEKMAYSYLKDAQLRGYVPRFFGAVRIAMSSERVHPSIDHIDGLMMEYIPGRTMGELEPGIDISDDDAEEVSQKVLTLGRCLRHYGVAHNDIHLNNIMLRAPSNDPVLIDWGRADIRNAEKNCSAEENWESTDLRQDFELDIRKILGHGRPWHPLRTPISNECREEQAQQLGWKTINSLVASHTPEELEKFYYRDHSVPDENSGLLWKVKPNVKTRPSFRPFEPLHET